MKFRQFLENEKNLSIEEALKIVKKKWRFEDNTNQGFIIEINDREGHSILDRIKDRTEMKLNDMNSKLQSGVDLMLKKNLKGFFKHRVSYVELTFKRSKFKAIYMIKPETKYLRISSIFEMDYSTEGAFYWDINEFKQDNPELSIKTLDLNESKIGCYFIDNIKNDKFFTVEMNEKQNSYDVYISDPNDVLHLELDI